ncbi:MAG: efflux RND transporter permease subunit [Oligoflexus sp.]
MKSLIEFFLRNHKFTMIILFFVVFVGINGMKKLNSESYPTVDLGVALIVTPYPGAGPEDVEADVTKLIEEKVRTVRGVKDVKSTSQIGLSRVVVRADIDKFEIQTVMDDVERAVSSVSGLPPGVPEPTYREINSEEFPALEIGIIGNNTNRKRDRFARFLKESMEDIPGVLQVEKQGYREREFSIYLHQELLRKNHVGAIEVVQTLRSRNINIPAGDIVNDQHQFLVRLNGKAQSVDELLQTPIRTNYTGQQILLKDVATVIDGEEDANILASVNGQPATLLVVTKRGGSDTIALVHAIEEKLMSIPIPDGLKVEVYNNEAEKVKNRTEVLISNAIAGLILVIIFMLIFLPGKIGFVASLSLPIALMGTIGLMPTLGMNLNVVTIAALVISLGMMVDNSVVISENYVRLREEGLESFEAAVKATHQFWLPITCTALTTIAAFIPMLVTKGILGQFILYLPMIVTIALLASLFESFFLLPMRLRLIDSRNPNTKTQANPKAGWFKQLTIKFESMMDLFIRRRYLIFLAFSGILIGSFYLLLVVNKFVLFPSEQTEVYLARIEMKKGTPLNETLQSASWLAQEIKAKLGDHVEHIVTIAGKSEQDVSDPKAKDGDNVGIIKIYVTREASFALHYTKALEMMRSIDNSRFEHVNFSTVINGPPVGAPVNLTFRSHNSTQLHELSYEVLKRVKAIPGIQNAEVNDTFGDDEIEIQLDHARIQRLGLSVAQVGETIKDLLDGRVISELNQNNIKFNIRLRLDDADKKEPRHLKNVQIMDRMGNLIPISQLAQLKQRDGALIIKRLDYQRSKTLTADINDTLITSAEANKQAIRIFHELNPQFKEVGLSIGGEEEQSRESMRSLSEAMVLALLSIFGVLVFLFKSYLRPLIIMSTIPLGLTGVAVSFLLHGIPLSFLAVVGIIGLAGIIVNAGIVLISFIDEMRLETSDSLHNILVKASGLRLKAVMVTALTTISGLIPTAYGIGGADLILMPMTLAMAWGLAAGTLLTLIWVPCAYALLEDFITLLENIWQRLRGKDPS